MIKLRKADVAQLVAASFPDYKGRKFVAEGAGSVTFHGLNWSGGGSRNSYVVLFLATGRRADLTRLARNHPARQPMEGQRVDIPCGVVVVEHSIFAGRDLGLRFYFNPADDRIPIGWIGPPRIGDGASNSR